MIAAVYYVAQNSGASSARLVSKLSENFCMELEKKNLAELKLSFSDTAKYDMVLIIAPTYGDQELQDTMEEFLLSLNAEKTSVKYIICEIGNYYGYDDYTFGSGQIIDKYLKQFGAEKLMDVESIDSLPQIDWNAANKWIDKLNKQFQQ